MTNYELIIIMMLSAMFIFDARNFNSRRIWYENQCQKMEPIYGASFWSACPSQTLHI